MIDHSVNCDSPTLKARCPFRTQHLLTLLYAVLQTLSPSVCCKNLRGGLLGNTLQSRADKLVNQKACSICWEASCYCWSKAFVQPSHSIMGQCLQSTKW